MGPIFEVGIQLMKAIIFVKYFIIHNRSLKLSSKLSSLWISRFKYIVCKSVKLLQWNIHLSYALLVVPHFHMYPFKVFLYHLMGYIHLITMGSHKFKCFARYITKCIMVSKLGGNTFSLNTSIVLGSITFAQILSKT